MRYLKYLMLFLVCFLLCVSSGCGYTTRAYIGPYQTVYVAPFKNSIDVASSKSEYNNYISYYPLMESIVTREVVDRFIFDGNLKVVNDESLADVTISGEITSYSRGALRYAENNEDVTEYRVTIFTNLTFYNNKSKKVIWQRNNYAGDSSYVTTGENAITEKAALDNAISDLARRIVEEVVEAW